MPPNPLGRLRRVVGMEQPCVKQNKRFLIFFMKDNTISGIFWGYLPTLCSTSPRFGSPKYSAKQSNAFCFFFWKKKTIRVKVLLTSWAGFAEVWTPKVFCVAEQTLFASFSGKRRVLSVVGFV
jgi:hypothetical protein